jgi:hypothetical protein
MAVSTDASYNASSRTIYHKVDIYLDGDSAAPLTVTRDNYMVTTSLLEEATSGDTPFDSVSSNEMTVNLNNENSLFTPTNADSEFYGKMKRGVKIIPYFRTSESDDWGQVGTFYVTDWSASPTSSVAVVTADDKLYNIFGQDAVDMPVVANMLVGDFYTSFFNLFGIVPVVDATVTASLIKAFNELGNKEFLSALSTAFFCICNCAHNGSVTIKELSTPQALRATITDADQVKTIDVKLSISSDYDSAYLKYYVPQESAEESVLNINEIDLDSESSPLTYTLDNKPLIRFKSISFSNNSVLFTFVSAEATSKTITIVLNNVPDNITTSLNVNGIYLEKVGYEIGSQEQNPLSVDNVYIQDTQSAINYKAIMDRFAANMTPVIQATIRGNPNLQVGDKIRLISTRYGVDFTGIIMRQNFDYDGGLSCAVTLLNSALVEVVA